MKVLIAYRTRYGATASCARRLSERLRAQAVVVDLAGPRPPSATEFDAVLIGGSIYGGKVQREVSSFCDREQRALLARPVGLFLCCLLQGERAEAQLRSSFPDWLTAHAFQTAIFGGILEPRKLHLLDRLLVTSVAPPRRIISRIDPEAIDRMADALNALIKT